VIDRIDSLALMLTGECNLRCRYCYLQNRLHGRMRVDTLRAAIDLALRASNRQVTILLTGGEPLLAMPLVREAVAHVEANRPDGKRVKLGLITNGIRLTPGVVSFAAVHGIDVQLSFDGVPEAQAVRGRRTFPVLNRRLIQLRRCHERFYRDRLSVAVTVTPSTVAHLADSVAYFLRIAVRRIDIAPAVTGESAANEALLPAIERQFSRIFDMSLDHLERTGWVPVTLFRKEGVASRSRARKRAMCGAGQGETLAVDPSGQMSACVMFSDASIPRSAPLAHGLGGLCLGDLRAPALRERHRRLAEACREAGVFDRREDKYSSYGRCGDCKYGAECMVCPAAIVHLAGNRDPNRIPDFHCAFNRVALRYRRRFPQKPGIQEMLDRVFPGASVASLRGRPGFPP